MSKAAERRPVDAQMIAAVANIVSAGYEVRPIGAGRDGVRRWAVNRPDPKTGGYYKQRSYFDRDGLVAAGLAGSKQGIRVAIEAAPKSTNHYINIREDETDMATKKTAAKKTAKKTTAARERADREARATRARRKPDAEGALARNAGATKGAPVGRGKGKAAAAEQQPAEQPEQVKQPEQVEQAEQPEQATTKRRAARATKTEGKSSRPSGADVPGATPEILAMLASYQPQTIERMNGQRVVETYLLLSGSTLDKPVTHKSLSPYPARIARELKRLGLFKTESVPEVGLVYLPAQA